MPRWFVIALVCAPGCLHPPDLTPGTTTGQSTGVEGSSGGGEESSGGSSTTGPDSGSGEGSSDAGTAGTSGESTSGSGTSGTSQTSGTTGVEPFCGDGHVDPEEECDDGLENGKDAPCTSTCARRRTVFITSEEYTPKDIGGLYYADSFCRQLAQDGGLDRYWTYVAWLSDSTISAGERLFKGRGPYVRVDGLQVTKNAEQFLSGQLDAPIVMTEGGVVLVGAGVWTGTLPDGSAVPGAQHCDDWTSESLQMKGHSGLASATDSWWTHIPDPEINPEPCGFSNHLFCMEGE